MLNALSHRMRHMLGKAHRCDWVQPRLIAYDLTDAPTGSGPDAQREASATLSPADDLRSTGDCHRLSTGYLAKNTHPEFPRYYSELGAIGLVLFTST